MPYDHKLYGVEPQFPTISSDLLPPANEVVCPSVSNSVRGWGGGERSPHVTITITHDVLDLTV